MKRRQFKHAQLSLFLSIPAPCDVTELCTRCGREIQVQHYIAGAVKCEFVGREGQCFECAFPLGKEIK